VVAALAVALIAAAFLPRLDASIAGRLRVVDLVPIAVLPAALALGLAPHTALIGTALAVAAAYALRRSRADARDRRLRMALPGVCEGLAAAIRAGLPLSDALVAIAPGQPVRVASALREGATLFRLGRPLDEALAPLATLFGPSSLLLRETLRAFHRRGGDVARALDRAATLARDESELEEEVSALTAQGRTSALVLALLAPCGLLFFLVANPAGARAFVSDPRGELLLSVALLLEGLGSLWLWRLVRR